MELELRWLFSVYKGNNVIEIHDGITFDFYTRVAELRNIYIPTGVMIDSSCDPCDS